ncbi:hypothetical protein [Brachybacterium sp. YJGR34]|uniref:hypothetical protein n=1 Tax=Brachybacterium sp. YJGR34 TaxID=2059911 RepID=UPI001300A1DF|nr:hypothetical protein [Brachybacterium sp. YJGR34]
MTAPAMTPSRIAQYRAARIAAVKAAQRAHRDRAEARFEDFEFMLSTGETLERALRRLGCTRTALFKCAQRYDRHDIVQLITEATR